MKEKTNLTNEKNENKFVFINKSKHIYNYVHYQNNVNNQQ